MKFRYLLFITVAFFGLGFFACEPENYDETIEEVLPTDTTKIITDKGTLLYRLQGRQNNFSNGFAKVVEDAQFYLVSSDSIECRADGSYSTRNKGFIISFFKLGENDFGVGQGFLIQDTNGVRSTVFSGSFVRNCATVQPIVTIRKETDNFLEGTYQAEFFELIGQDPNDCASWRSVGVLTAEFAVPLEVCQ